MIFPVNHRRLADRSSEERRSTSPAPHPSSANSAEGKAHMKKKNYPVGFSLKLKKSPFLICLSLPLFCVSPSCLSAALDVDSTPLAVLRGQRKVEELRIETYVAANIRCRPMDESEEAEETVESPPPPSSSSPSRLATDRDVRMADSGGFDDDLEEDQGVDSSSSSPSHDNQNLK